MSFIYLFVIIVAFHIVAYALLACYICATGAANRTTSTAKGEIMGREVRRVPSGWQHPKDEHGRYVPLFDGGTYRARTLEWDEEYAKWSRGEFPDYADEDSRKLSYEEWNGARPNPDDYMPNWPDSERTHLMMYEDTTEGTPISPAFDTPEKLAQWLADTGASSFGSSTANYEAWLRVARGGWAPSAVFTPNAGLISGVEAMGGGK